MAGSALSHRNGQAGGTLNISASAGNLRVRPIPKHYQTLNQRVQNLHGNLCKNKATTDEHHEFLSSTLAEVKEMKALRQAKEADARNRVRRNEGQLWETPERRVPEPNSAVGRQPASNIIITPTDSPTHWEDGGKAMLQVTHNANDKSPHARIYFPTMHIEHWSPKSTAYRIEPTFPRLSEAAELRRKQDMHDFGTTLGMTPGRPQRFHHSRSLQALPGKTMSSFTISERRGITSSVEEYGGICGAGRSEQRRQLLFGASGRSMLLPGKSRASFQQTEDMEGCTKPQKSQASFIAVDLQTGAASREPCETELHAATKSSLRWGASQEISFQF